MPASDDENDSDETESPPVYQSVSEQGLEYESTETISDMISQVHELVHGPKRDIGMRRSLTEDLWSLAAINAVPPQAMTMTMTLSAGDAQPLPPLTKEQAMADTMRALQECYPDRWERIWEALGKTSASDAAVAQIGKLAASDPRSAAGALLGGIIGAALGKIR